MLPAQGLVIDRLDGILGGSPLQNWWHNIYAVLVVVLGQDLPESTASFVDQLFALLVASAGLAAFALVLALVEQVQLRVKQYNQSNMGGPLFGDWVLLCGPAVRPAGELSWECSLCACSGAH